MDSDDEDHAFIVNAEKQACSIYVKIVGLSTDLIIDSGATLLVHVDLSGKCLRKQQ